MNWKLFKQIINDRNRKFLNEFWDVLFVKLKIWLLYNTVYYFQTNKFFERINQSVKIVFRYYLIILNKLIMWSNALSSIQREFNNLSSTTEWFSNKYVYKFISTEFSDLCFPLNVKNVKNVQNFFSMKWTY